VTRLLSLPLLGAALVATAVLRLSARRAGVVLVYHAVGEEGGSADELVRPHDAELFEAQLRHLRARYRLVSAEELLQAVAERRRGQRFPVAVTLDDDLGSHVSRAAPILRRVGVPATFFLSGASLDRPHAFWWQRLQRAVSDGLAVPVEGRDVHEIAERIEEMSPEGRSHVEAWLAEHVAADADESGIRGLQVRELAEEGFDIGFHTLGHERLTGLDDDALSRALSRGRERLEEAAGRPLTALAYPHGKADLRVALAARSAGFRVGFTGVPEPVGPASDPLLLGRFEPSHASVGALAAQLVRTMVKRSHR
jgi:peptidoglycan/xylan/chitin deacetylase (PgdA/CDA1 family)